MPRASRENRRCSCQGRYGLFDGEADLCWRGRRLRVEEDGGTAGASELPLGHDEDQRVAARIVGGGVVDDDQVGETAGRSRCFAVLRERDDGAGRMPGKAQSGSAIERRRPAAGRLDRRCRTACPPSRMSPAATMVSDVSARFQLSVVNSFERSRLMCEFAAADRQRHQMCVLRDQDIGRARRGDRQQAGAARMAVPQAAARSWPWWR